MKAACLQHLTSECRSHPAPDTALLLKGTASFCVLGTPGSWVPLVENKQLPQGLRLAGWPSVLQTWQFYFSL